MAKRPADSVPSTPFDTTKFIHAAQVGGAEASVLDSGPAKGVRAVWVNTGGGLRYRILVDRGLDIDQAFFNQYSLAFLTHKGLAPPAQGLERGIDWLKTFQGGLLTSCGPFNIGAPSTDAGEDLPLHGPHSNTPAEIEQIVQPDPHAGRNDVTIVGVLRYGKLFGPNLTLRRTIRSVLGQNSIEIADEFFNAGNQSVPHAWLLHLNFGYPLVDAGAEFCYDAKVVPLANPVAQARFRPGGDYKRIPAPLQSHRGATEAVAYLYPKPTNRDGQTTVGLVNRKIGVGLAVDYNTSEFTRCVNWQHWGPGEYVTALEPANGSVEGRAKDRAEGTMDSIEPGGRKNYRYTLRIVTEKGDIQALRGLNG